MRHTLSLFITAMMVVSMTTPRAAVAASTTSSVVAIPSGSSVFRESLTAIRMSLHQVHGKVTEVSRDGAKRTTVRIRSDCIMTPSSIRGSFSRWRVGDARSSKQYVMELNFGKRTSRTWLRSAATGNRWQRADSDNSALSFIILCPVLLVRSLQQGVSPLPISPGHPRNLGVATTAGHATWHLRSEAVGSHERLDFFVDQRTHYWVRFVQSTHRKASQTRSVLDYSRFNMPVSISLP